MIPTPEPELRDRPGAQPVERGGIVNGISLVLNGLSLMVAFILVVVLFFTWQSVADLTELEKRLGELTQFERRIAAKLDTVNQGVHSQFDGVQRQSTQLTGQIVKLEQDLAAIQQRLSQLTAAINALAQAPAPAVAAQEPEPMQPAAAPPLVAPDRVETSSQPAAAPGFERIETPDGKVTYSKVR